MVYRGRNLLEKNNKIY
jgi:hypothetical protein